MAGRLSRIRRRGREEEQVEPPAAQESTPGEAWEAGSSEPSEPHTELQPTTGGESGGRRGDTDERIKVATTSATQAAESVAMEEIMALEEDFERARQESAAALTELEARVREAERRAEEAEARARASQQTEGDQEGAAKAAAADWLRGQIRQIQREADRRVADARREARRESEEKLRAMRREADERVRSARRRRGGEPAEAEAPSG